MLGRFLTEFPLFVEDLDLGPTVIHMSRKLVLGKRYSNDQSDQKVLKIGNKINDGENYC